MPHWPEPANACPVVEFDTLESEWPDCESERSCAASWPRPQRLFFASPIRAPARGREETGEGTVVENKDGIDPEVADFVAAILEERGSVR